MTVQKDSDRRVVVNLIMGVTTGGASRNVDRLSAVINFPNTAR